MMKKLNLTLFTVLSLFLLGCATPPSHLIVSPKLMVPANINYQDKQAQLTVTDMRTAQHLVQILRVDEAAELISSQQSLTDIFKKTLQLAFEKQGLTLNAMATNHIEVIIDKALINVEQTLMSYKAKNDISLRVKVNNAQQTLTTTFNSKGASNGPLKADIAVLERDFNQQLNALLSRILTSEEIKTFIK